MFHFSNKLAEVAQKKSFERLDLNECSLAFAWRYPEIDIKDITVEEKGKFRIEGDISVRSPGVARHDQTWDLPVNTWIGCRILKKCLAGAPAAICGLTCICPGRLMIHDKTLASASSNFSKNRRALISASYFASSAIGSRKHLAAISAAKKWSGRPPASLRTLIMPAKNVEFTLESPVLSVRNIAVSNWIVRNILPFLDHMIRGVATGDPNTHAAKQELDLAAATLASRGFARSSSSF